jgi:hypothetical protein
MEKENVKESRIRTVLKSVLNEKKHDDHYKSSTEPEMMKDKIKGKGAEDMMKGANDEIAKGPDAHLDEPEMIKKDRAKMTSNVKKSAMRKTDNPKGDTNIVPGGTQMKDPAAMKVESYDKMSDLKAAYASMYAEKVEEDIEESYTHEVDYAEEGPHTAKKFVAHAKKAGIKAKIHTMDGPGGGHPVVHLGHKDDSHVHKFLKKHYDPDMEKGDLQHHKLGEGKQLDELSPEKLHKAADQQSKRTTRIGALASKMAAAGRNSDKADKMYDKSKARQDRLRKGANAAGDRDAEKAYQASKRK